MDNYNTAGKFNTADDVSQEKAVSGFAGIVKMLSGGPGKTLTPLTRKEKKAVRKAYAKELGRRKGEIKEAKKALAPYNNELKKRRRAKLLIPRTVADTIPYVADYDEGVFEVEHGRYSKSYYLSDINYLISNDSEQEAAFIAYGEFLNYFPDGVTVQVTIDNSIISMSEMESRVFYPLAGDSHDKHREEYNKILKRQIVAGRNDIKQGKYVTVTIPAMSPIEAIIAFAKIDGEIIANIKKIGSSARAMTTAERLELLHDKFRPGYEGEFSIDYEFVKKQGLSSKDYISPPSFHFGPAKDFMIGDGHYRVLTLANLPASLTDEVLKDLASCDFPLIITKSIEPVAPDKALRLVRRQLTGMEANKIEAQKRAARAGYSTNIINNDLRQSLGQAQELLDDLLNKNQKLFFVTITMMAYGRNLEELSANTASLNGIARKYTCQLKCLNYQQEEGFRLTLPLGRSPRHLSVERALTTESTAIFMPFSIQELFQKGGFYYGLNQISRSLIMCDRHSMMTPSGFSFGTSGSGKTFSIKREMLNVLLKDGRTVVIIIDPENEYSAFVRRFGGTVVKISPDSLNYINPMDMGEDYGLDEDDGDNVPLSAKKTKALRKKSDFIMSIIERMVNAGAGSEASGISPQQKTIIDRCVKQCYGDYLLNDFDPRFLPTMMDLQAALENEDSAEAAHVADAAEYYTRGSLDIFSHRTNVDVDNRLISFNVRDMGEQLRPIAQMIMFDYIWNRMVQNKAKKVRTYCYCDEIHTMFANYYSSYILKQLYKRGRKYGLVITGITQNVEELLRSEMARGMIGNSDFLYMLNQSPQDLNILVQMLNISPAQATFLQNAPIGSGLLKAQDVIVPFKDEFPEDSYLYELMSSRFAEGRFAEGGDEGAD
ncbi:MAG: DUF87 domain-containing protein [Lachnospiraceae bacterium]|nr:DUF87 domain-containing protein [Lachnospiraceae bacterium]